MIVSKCVGNNLLKKCLKTVSINPCTQIHNRARIGNRDWVGWGYNGAPVYLDEPAYPCPAIRFKENTNELLALREKEKGDWRKLCLEEKKCLYRASFRQTLTEVEAPTGEWKSVVGITFFLVSIGVMLYIVTKLNIYDPKPKTFTKSYRQQTLRRVLDLRIGHLTGPPAYWDYEKDDWKK